MFWVALLCSLIPADPPVDSSAVTVDEAAASEESPDDATPGQKRSDDKPDSAAYVDEDLGLTFPRTLGGLTFANQSQFPQPGLGYAVRYSDGELTKFDVYVYDGDLESIPDGHTDDVIRQQVAETGNLIKYMASKGYYSDVRSSGEGVFPEDPSEGQPAFRFNQFTFMKNAAPRSTDTGLRVSETYVRGFRNHFLKVRTTYDEATAEATRPAREAALTELLKLSVAAAEPAADDTATAE